jgi:hypothetical protein
LEQLDKLLKLVPNDEMGKQLRDEMKTKLPKPPAIEAPPTPQPP